MQEEVESLKTEIFALREDEATTQEMAKETQKVAERVKATFRETRMATAKAKLFKEEVYKEKKLNPLDHRSSQSSPTLPSK